MRKFIIQTMGSKTSTDNANNIISNLKQIDLPFLINGEKIECPKFTVKIACGLFGITDDFIEDRQSLDQLFIKNKNTTFFFECDGDSMEPTIRAGQILIVDRSITDFHNRVCVIRYDDKLMCKRVFIRQDSIILRSDNQKYKDIYIFNQESSLLWGVVTGIAGFIK